jgi:hypothetical protein
MYISADLCDMANAGLIDKYLYNFLMLSYHLLVSFLSGRFRRRLSTRILYSYLSTRATSSTQS